MRTKHREIPRGPFHATAANESTSVSHKGLFLDGGDGNYLSPPLNRRYFFVETQTMMTATAAAAARGRGAICPGRHLANGGRSKQWNGCHAALIAY